MRSGSCRARGPRSRPVQRPALPADACAVRDAIPSQGSGSDGSPPRQTSKWRCGPVATPVFPTSPSAWPTSTASPGRAQDRREVAVAGREVARVAHLDDEAVPARPAGPDDPARRRGGDSRASPAGRRGRCPGACGACPPAGAAASRTATRARPARRASGASRAAARWKSANPRARAVSTRRPKLRRASGDRAGDVARRRAPAALVVVPLRLDRDAGADELEERRLRERAREVAVEVGRERAPRGGRPRPGSGAPAGSRARRRARPRS